MKWKREIVLWQSGVFCHRVVKIDRYDNFTTLSYVVVRLYYWERNSRSWAIDYIYCSVYFIFLVQRWYPSSSLWSRSWPWVSQKKKKKKKNPDHDSWNDRSYHEDEESPNSSESSFKPKAEAKPPCLEKSPRHY